MAQAGFTPILIYGSGTTGNAPSAGNLTSSSSGAELALNYFDGKLFYKDAASVVQVLATKGTGVIGGSNTQVQYNSSGALEGSSNLTFDGSTLTVNGISVGRGLGGSSTNTAVGASALANTSTTANTAFGASSMQYMVGASNTAVGFFAMAGSTTPANNTGLRNVAIGYQSMQDVTSGSYNVAIGYESGEKITTASFNTVMGYRAGANILNGSSNTAVGNGSLFYTVSAVGNTAVGSSSAENMTGGRNTAMGQQAMYGTFGAATGSDNVAVGYRALYVVSSGSYNVGIGSETLNSCSSGSYNVGIGNSALFSCNTGASNISIGYASLYSLQNGSYNVALGETALNDCTDGTFNIAIGAQANLANISADYNIAIGGRSLLASPNTQQSVAIGYEAISSISSGTAGNMVAVGHQSLGQMRSTNGLSVAVGAYALYGSSASPSSTGGGYSTSVGAYSLYDLTTGERNVAVGYQAGYSITTGSKNTIVGSYTGNGSGLDIRTLSNRIVLSDGDGNPRWYIDNNGAAGYGPSTGGTVTQVGSRTTGVTINKPTGTITLVSANGSNVFRSFTVTNNTVTELDTVIVSQKSGTDTYQVFVTNVAAGSFRITFATTGGTTTEQPVFAFAVIKGQIS